MVQRGIDGDIDEEIETKTKTNQKKDLLHPLRIISGLKETFMKRNIVQKTNTQKLIRPEEQTEKVESCQNNLWDEIQLNEP